MTERTGEHAEVGSASWLLLGYATILVLVSTTQLFWLLWTYVPAHAAVFEGMGIELPRATLITIAMSNWFVRLYSFLVLLLVLGTGVIAIWAVWSAIKGSWRLIVGSLATVGLVIGLSELVAGALIVRSVHAGYSSAVTGRGERP